MLQKVQPMKEEIAMLILHWIAEENISCVEVGVVHIVSAHTGYYTPPRLYVSVYMRM